MEAVSLARYLGPDRPLFGLRLPELESQTGILRVEDIAEYCAAEMRKLRPEGPFALAGWCSAGFIGLEIAKQLERQGAQVPLVAMFDARTVYLPPMSLCKRWIVQGCHLAQRVQHFVSRVMEEGQAPVQTAFSSRLPAKPGPSGRFEKMLAATMNAYRPEPWSGRIVHIWAAQRPKGFFRDPEFICGFLSPNGFGFYEVPGNHNSMLAEPRIAEVSRILAGELDRAEAAAGGRNFQPAEALRNGVSALRRSPASF